MVDHGSTESAAAATAGSPWSIRDFWSFVQKTYNERDVSDLSQIYPNIHWSKKLGDMPGGRGTLGVSHSFFLAPVIYHGAALLLIKYLYRL